MRFNVPARFVHWPNNYRAKRARRDANRLTLLLSKSPVLTGTLYFALFWGWIVITHALLLYWDLPDNKDMAVATLKGFFAVGATAVIIVQMLQLLNKTNSKLEAVLAAKEDELSAFQEKLKFSERRFQSLVENLPDVIWSSAEDGTSNYLSPNVETIFGTSSEEACKPGYSRFGRIHPEDFQRVSEAFVDLFRKGSSYDEEYRFRHEDGSWIWVHDRASDTHVEDGVVYADGICTDITERRRTEGALNRQVSMLRAVMFSAANALFMLDREGRTTFANPAAGTMFGYEQDELMGRVLHDMLHGRRPDGSHLPVTECAIARTYLAGEALQAYEDTFYDKSGAPIRILASTAPVIVDREVQGAVLAVQDISERWSAEVLLRESEGQLRSIIEHAPLGICRVWGDRVTLANPAFVEMLGYQSEAEVLALVLGKDIYVNESQRAEIIARFGRGQWVTDEPATWRKKDGTHIKVLITGHAIHSPDAPSEYEAFVRDVTQHEQLEAQLLQARKMEAIGQLAGGVAHDFNNLLTVIGLNSELALANSANPVQVQTRIQEITKASQRAATLTTQLLAFSRKQRFELRVLDLNEVVTQFLPMVQRMIGEDIEIVVQLAAQAGLVRIDPGQIDQVLLNLAGNARDAMPSGGKLIIETELAIVDAGYTRTHPGLKPGHYVMLSVSDDGCGMDAETKSRIFEPFFTTKEVGKGTGLGLSTVYGIIKQTNGYISVYSEPGQGTTFKIFLPQQNQELEAEEVDSLPENRSPKGERILVVDDEQALAEIVTAQLEAEGYSVLLAGGGEKALEIAASRKDIDLVLTDVVLPGMNGKQLADELLQLRPNLKVLFMSGYAANLVLDEQSPEQTFSFISKPFSREKLVAKVSQILQEKVRKPGTPSGEKGNT